VGGGLGLGVREQGCRGSRLRHALKQSGALCYQAINLALQGLDVIRGAGLEELRDLCTSRLGT